MAIAEILFHEIASGDVRKFNASSNDAGTGGGARDLRFGMLYEHALDRLFPKEIVTERGHEYRLGTFYYKDADGVEHEQDNVHYAFKPKTDGKRREVRLCQLNKIPFFQKLPDLEPDDGLLFVAFIRMTEGLPQMQFLTEKQINDPNSNQIIAAAMRKAIDTRAKGTSVKFTVKRREVITMDDVLLAQAEEIVGLLEDDKNVLLTGAPATGKTTLLNLVEQIFTSQGETIVDPNGPAAFPLFTDEEKGALLGGIYKNRKVFRTTFHQGTKYRDFVRGLIPVPEADTVKFKVSEGILWQAAEFAKQPESAALLIIDEINRGPAVSVFGDMISAFEADKRLGDDGSVIQGKTVTVKILNDEAKLVDYQLPSRLYILAAMNQADSSVEPMDAAFMRRWKRAKLLPSKASLCRYFDIDEDIKDLPENPSSAEDVYRAAVSAWDVLNRKIGLGRGDDYQIGQGVFMKRAKEELPQDIDGALQYVADCWPIIDAHIEEIFFNDKEAIAYVLNAHEGAFFKVSDYTFAGRQVIAIQQPYVTSKNVYEMLLSLLG